MPVAAEPLYDENGNLITNTAIAGGGDNGTGAVVKNEVAGQDGTLPGTQDSGTGGPLGGTLDFNNLDGKTPNPNTNTENPKSNNTPVDRSLTIIIRNDSVSKGQTRYGINGNFYDEGSRTVFNVNKFNDIEKVDAVYEVEKFKPKYRFELIKKIEGTDVSIIVRKRTDGVDKWEDSSPQLLPNVITLDYDYVAVKPAETTTSTPTTTTTTNYTLTQNIGFSTNYGQSTFNIKVESADLGETLNLKVNDVATITTKNRALNDVKISVSNTGNYDLVNLKWGYVGGDITSTEGFKDGYLTIPANKLTKNISVFVELKPADAKIAGIQTQGDISFNVESSILRSSTLSKQFTIPISVKSCESVLVKTPYGEKVYNISAGNNYEGKSITLDLKNDFKNNIGSFKVVLVSKNVAFGDTPNPASILVKLTESVDVPIIDNISYPSDIVIPTYTMGEYPFSISYESKLADYVVVYYNSVDDNHIVGKYGSKDTIPFNFNELKTKGIFANGKIDFIFVPYNDTDSNGTGTIKTIVGDEKKITINIDDPGIYVTVDKFKRDLFDAIKSNIKLNISDNPKYLNHLAEFDKEDKQIVISNWDIDYSTFTNFTVDEMGNTIPVDINQSIVLKLYEPLPTTFVKNDTLWISELMSLPIVKTITVSGQSVSEAVYLRGPNFGIEVDFVKEQSTAFESLDNLILSGSTTSQGVVDKYLYDNLFDVDKVNIDYSNFGNFIKYSSAVERLANFKYKKELLEYYDDRIAYLQSYTGSVSAVNEITNYNSKKVNLLNAFDGWENYLVSSSTSTFPKDGNGFAQRFTSGTFDSNGGYSVTYYPSGSTWFNSTLSDANSFDKENGSALKNNIPLHLIDSNENGEYLLFLDMIGHHFDIIWSYIKGVTDSKNITETSSYGIHDDLLYNYLKSFGWNAKNLNSNTQLWEYLFGKDGEETTPEQRTKTIWRRIANNLPYLLKHKGTKRGISALLNCYGISNSNLSIIEFGGPDEDDAVETTKYIYDVETSTLVMNSGSYLTTNFSGSNAIEIRIKPYDSGSSMTLLSSSYFNLVLEPGVHQSGISGSLILNTLVSGGLSTIQTTPEYQFYDGNYHSILLNHNVSASVTTFDLYYKMGEKDRIVKSGSYHSEINNSYFTSASSLTIGGNFVGEIDEFRLWNTPLSESAFELHVLHPEATNGNHISSSTTDLQLRLDFEYPHSLYQSASVRNIAPVNTFQTFISASGFTSQSQYPYNYKPIERVVSLEIPNSGASRYTTNKVRFEDQTLISDLSYKSRATKKAFETSKRDSNRLGIFFSPNKDLDLDIAKSFGGVSIDDYIGAWDDQYNDTYKDLTDLRNYYFERISERDIYQFINLVRLYDKSLFDNLKEMLPARVKATTGLLIAPHLLERSKVAINKPTAENTTYTSSIDTKETTLIGGEVNLYDINLSASNSLSLVGELDDYSMVINAKTQNTLSGSYDTYETTITDFDINNVVSVELDDLYTELNATKPTAAIDIEFNFNAGNVVGIGENYLDYGYSIYWNNGWGKYNYLDYDGVYRTKAVRGFLVTKREDKLIPTNDSGISGSYYENNTLTTTYTNELIIQEAPYTASLITDPNIVALTTASGYLKSHYIYTKDRSPGLENSYFRGSKQTSATTIDGRDAVEAFESNPTILRVNPNGRPNNEPILIVD